MVDSLRPDALGHGSDPLTGTGSMNSFAAHALAMRAEQLELEQYHLLLNERAFTHELSCFCPGATDASTSAHENTCVFPMRRGPFCETHLTAMKAQVDR